MSARRIFVPVYDSETCNPYYVDVCLDNPGPIFVGGEYADWHVGAIMPQGWRPDDLQDAAGHVRLYRYHDGRGFLGVWCPYTKSREMSGWAFGAPVKVHHARAGRLWCHGSQDYEDVQ